MHHSLFRFSLISSILILFTAQIQPCYSQEYYEEITYSDTLDPFTVLPINYDTIIVGVRTDNPYAYGYVIRSFDGGNSWEYAGLNQTHVYCFLKGVGDTIYAGTGHGVYRSGDFGENWEHILPLTNNVVCLARIQPDKLFVGFGGGIMRSLDNGITWDTSLVLNQNSCIDAILPVSENEIYAGGPYYTTPDAGMFMSQDLGETWDYIGLRGYNIQALGYNSDNELFVGCYYSGLLKTSDFGITWETVLPHKDVMSIIIDFDEMYIGCEGQSFLNGGIFYSSDNGVTWEDRTYNITNNHITEIYITPDQYFYSLSRWETASQGPPFNRSVDPVFINERNSPKYLNVNIFPNPASDFLHISMPSACRNSGKLNISIYDQTGHLIKNDSTFLSPEIQTFNTDITNLPPGIYFIKIIVDRSRYLHKFIVQ